MICTSNHQKIIKYKVFNMGSFMYAKCQNVNFVRLTVCSSIKSTGWRPLDWSEWTSVKLFSYRRSQVSQQSVLRDANISHCNPHRLHGRRSCCSLGSEDLSRVLDSLAFLAEILDPPARAVSSHWLHNPSLLLSPQNISKMSGRCPVSTVLLSYLVTIPIETGAGT